MYLLNQNGSIKYPYSFAQLKSDHPQTSFPSGPNDSLLESFNVYPVRPVDRPAVTSAQRVDEGDPAQVDGVWTQVWIVRDATAEEIAADQAALFRSVVNKTQSRLDAFARTRSYDGIQSACTYATSTVPRFQAEGQYCVEARDATWAKLYEMLAEVRAGTRPVPSGFSDVEPGLPALTWPTLET